MGKSSEYRFWTKVSFGTEHWLWTGSLNPNGYGVFHYPDYRHAVSVARFAYEFLVGPIPRGLVIDHLCRTPACVNPTHLEVVTQRENLLRGVGWNATNAAKTHCPKGHPYAGDNLFYRDGGRRCRECSRIRQRIYNNRVRHPLPCGPTIAG